MLTELKVTDLEEMRAAAAKPPPAWARLPW